MSRKCIVIVSFLPMLCVCNNASAEIIAEFTWSSDCALPLRAGIAYAMAFDVTDSPTVTEVQLKLRRWRGSTGEVVMELHPDSSRAPSSATAARISRPVEEVSLDEPTWVSFKWQATGTTIFPGRWWIVCKLTSDSDAEIDWQMVPGNPYGDGKDTLRSFDDGSTWPGLLFGDANFKVFGPRSSQATTTVITPDPNEVAVSGVATIEVTVRDSNGVLIPGLHLGRVTLIASDGTLGRTVMGLGNGRASTTWRAPASHGNQTITADYQGHIYAGVDYQPSTGGTTIRVIAEDRGTYIELFGPSLTRTRIQSSISVRVKDELNNLVPGGTVSFSCTPSSGTFSSKSEQVVNGQAWTTWTAGNTAGTFTIEASYSGHDTGTIIYGANSISHPVTVDYTNVYTQTGVNISPSYPYKGKSTFVIVEVRDPSGKRVPGGTVEFSAPSGWFEDPSIDLWAWMKGSTKWHAPSSVGVLWITANYLGHTAGGNRYLASNGRAAVYVVEDNDSTGSDLSWMSEWVSDYNPSGEDPLPGMEYASRGFTDKLTSALGWSGDEYCNSSARAFHMRGDWLLPPWKAGRENDYMDNHDFTWYGGHGNPDYITFTHPWSVPYYDRLLRHSQAYGAWGDNDAEWAALYSCKVLANRSYWASTMNGLHLICGFHTNARSSRRFGEIFAELMIKEWAFDDEPYKIHQAWFIAGDITQPNNRKQIVVGENSGMFLDYIWGQGYVCSDPIVNDRHYWYSHDIENFPPIAHAGGPYSGVAGQQVQLDGSRSWDPDPEDYLFYYWDLDLNTSTDPCDWDRDGVDEPNDDGDLERRRPYATFSAPGIYNIRLIVRDDNWNTDGDYTTVTVTTTSSSPGKSTPTVMQGQQNGGLEIIDNFDPATLPTEVQMPILQVADTSSAFNEMMQFGGYFGMDDCNSTGARLDERGNWNTVKGNHELTVNQHTSGVMYVNRARAYIFPEPFSGLPPEDDTILMVEDFLNANGIQRPGAVLDDVTHIFAGEAEKGSRTYLSNIPFQRRVNYRRTIDAMGQPYPVVGAGGKLTVMMGEDPLSPVLFVKVWRNASPADEVNLIGAESAIAEFHRLGPKALIGGSVVPPCNRIEIDNVSLGYYEDDFVTLQNTILPVYILDLTCEDDKGSQQVQMYMSAVIPPLEAIIEDPNTGTEVAHGDQVTFSGSAAGGSNPDPNVYTYNWYSDADGFIGSGRAVQSSQLSVNSRDSEVLPHSISLTVTDPVGFENTSFINLTVRFQADFNQDGQVNLIDLSAFVDSWLAEAGDPNYNQDADFNSDAIVNFKDLSVLASEWLR